MSEQQKLANTDIKSIRRNAMEAITLCQSLIISYEETESYENIETVNRIIKANFRILSDTQDAQEYGRLDAYIPQVFDLGIFLEDVVNTCKSVLRQTRIAISCDCENGIFVSADPDRLLACLLTLITNSAEHMDTEIGDGEIKLKATKLTDSVSLSVIDNGYGMDSSKLESFLDYSKSKGGLAVVKKFCDVIGSALITDTSPDCGFMASFRLPIADNTDVSARSSQPMATISTFSPYNIYLSKISEAIIQFEI